MSASARTRVRQALEHAGPRGCTTAELCQPAVGGERFGARLMELRGEGLIIKGVPVRQGSWRYTLITDPEAGAGEDPAVSPSSTTPPPVVAAVQTERAAVTRLGARLGIGPLVPFHCCDYCGYKWHEPADWWPDECPSCHVSVAWISSFRFRFQLVDYVPLCQSNEMQAAA